jgi:hypothetical protein
LVTNWRIARQQRFANRQLFTDSPTFRLEHKTKRSIDAQAAFNATTTVAAATQYVQPSTRTNQNNGLGQKLQTVARIVAARSGLGASRQVFSVSIGGFDAHDNQNRARADLMARLSHAIGYFEGVMGTMNLQDSVTLFTGSDFGRTFTSNGDGTDHGWGRRCANCPSLRRREHAAVLNGLGQVAHLDAGAARQVGHGARHAQHAVVAAR